MTQVPGGMKPAAELFSLFNEMEQHKDTVQVHTTLAVKQFMELTANLRLGNLAGVSC